jgi:glycosyltransferase involved in cell wall biosynthesis
LTEQLRRVLHARGVVAPRVAVEHDAVDAERFACAASHEWDGQAPVAVYAGHLFPEKGVGTLVEAARLLDDVRVKVVGGMPQHVREWRERVGAGGPPNVEFLGHWDPDRIPPCLKAADVLVLPNSSRHAHSALYTSPMKLFEYMAAGRPIVASDVPALREVLRHGENAWLVAPDDPGALAEGIHVVLRDRVLGPRLSAQASSDVRAHTWTARVRRIVEAAGFSLEAGPASP